MTKAQNNKIKLNGEISVSDYSTPQLAVNSLVDRSILNWGYKSSYTLNSQLSIVSKPGTIIKFNNQLLDFSSVSSPQNGVYFKTMSLSDVDGIFVIGNKTNITAGIHFDADASGITIHQRVGKIYASNCNTGILVGSNLGYQYSDSMFTDMYGADSVVGIKFTGENTLAMYYAHVEAYNNDTIGVHFEQGGGNISHLQVADSGSDLYFGQTNGQNHNKLNRWDIAAGYSEIGASGERWIDSAKCTDTNPFNEEITISGYRVTPFTSSGVADFIRWRLNGDLVLNNCTITHGQHLPVIAVDSNTSYRPGRVILNGGVIEANPKSAPQVAMTYTVANPKQKVIINSRVNNGQSFWNNGGAANEGVIASGIYMSKLDTFTKGLFNYSGIQGVWDLTDISSGTCLNKVPSRASLILSAALERRDFWMDDGLVGFFRNSTTSKTLSTTSSNYPAAAEYTFGMILRTTGTGTDETSNNTLGGTGGISIGIGDTAGAFVRCQVGAFTAQATPTNPLDAHLVIGRYISGTSTKVDAINLRTGEIVSASSGAPLFGSLTWANGVSLRNDLCVRGCPFVFNRALTDLETRQILQSALALTDTWR
jgi:hypothetical protein